MGNFSRAQLHSSLPKAPSLTTDYCWETCCPGAWPAPWAHPQGFKGQRCVSWTPTPDREVRYLGGEGAAIFPGPCRPGVLPPSSAYTESKSRPCIQSQGACLTCLGSEHIPPGSALQWCPACSPTPDACWPTRLGLPFPATPAVLSLQDTWCSHDSALDTLVGLPSQSPHSPT